MQLAFSTCMLYLPEPSIRLAVDLSVELPPDSTSSLLPPSVFLKFRSLRLHDCKKDNFQMKGNDIFLIVAQNIDCEYTLEPPC